VAGKKLLVRLSLFSVALIIIAVLGAYIMYRVAKGGLPDMITMQDYHPLMVSQVYDRNHKKIGEFYRERRTLVPLDKIPKHVINAFLAAEDDQFYEHGGLNYQAILRSTLANLRAGHSVQGGSTITQQVAKTLMLSPEKTLLRKIREALLAIEMEKNLSKDEILYLYLNQIYFGKGAYGVENAAQTYFRKPISQVTIPEAAILASLPKAPTKFSPISNPSRAKERQIYVLNRMGEVNFISKEEAAKAIKEPVKFYVLENYIDNAPFYLETVRQILVQQLGEEAVLDQGINVYTSLDLEKQKAAQESVRKGLKELDKRQGYRGAIKNIAEKDEMEKVISEEKKRILTEYTPERILLPDGTFEEIKEPTKKDNKKTPLPFYMKTGSTVQAIVEKVDDAQGLVYVRLPDARGIIDFETMTWARKPDTEKRYDLDQIKKPSQALKDGDLILVSLVSERASMPSRFTKNLKKGQTAPTLPDFGAFVGVELDQEPIVEGSLLSFDQETQEILAMVGGYKFIPQKNEFNRALQAARQTGSSFKAIVYASALDKGYTPATPIMDAPVVFEEQSQEEGQDDVKTWKPSNHGKTFGGEIIFRNALVKSLNVPTVKIIEDIGVPWAADYARRLGIFNPLNMDFTLALGSSSVTLYEMTKVFSTLGRMGKRIRPVIIHNVKDKDGKDLMKDVSLDIRFDKQIAPFEEEYKTRREAFLARQQQNPDQQTPEDNKKPDKNFFFQDPEQLIKPTTSYVISSVLRGVVEDPSGTGQRAKALGREVAGKTGTTNGYFDAWFLGYTAQIATGVWVGFDSEKSLGKGEVGGRSALPIWVDYMKEAHEGLPLMSLPVPNGIVFANIDSDTGKLASATTKHVLRQAFVEGTEPTTTSNKDEETTDFYKEDLTQ
jgi:penicillin-binding protein 1A